MAGGACQRCGAHGGLWPMEVNLTLCERCRREWNGSHERTRVVTILNSWLRTQPVLVPREVSDV